MSSSDPQKPTTGRGAGDTARTQQIPRVQDDKPASGASGSGRPTARHSGGGAAPASRDTTRTTGTGAPAAAKKPERSSGSTVPAAKKPASAKDAAVSSGSMGTKSSAAKPSTASSDARSASSAATSAGTASASRTTSPAGTDRSAPASRGERSTRDGSAAAGTPMTARDYARTTKESPDSTSVIPAVTSESAAPTGGGAPAANRRAKLHLVRIDPWSVTRLAFVVSVALMIVSVVAVTIFWIVLDLAGVWDSLNGTITNVLSDGDGAFDLTDYLGLGRLIGLTLLLSAINVIVLTALATIAAHLYNLAAQLLGGIGMTFADD